MRHSHWPRGPFVGDRCGSKKLGGAVGPETASLRKKREGKVSPSQQYVSTHAFQNGTTGGISKDVASFHSSAERSLHLNKMAREPSYLEIREVLTIAQADAHCLKSRELLHQPDEFPNGIRSRNLAVQQSQDADGQPLALLRSLELVFQRVQLTFTHGIPLSRRSCRTPSSPPRGDRSSLG
jgi:hypothetical protein